ncbi:MAG: phosphatase family protein [Rhodospirillales bacterium]|nr:phosphatase family protein [Rhodospirillales bacterium]
MSFDGFDLPILRFLTGFVGRSPLADHLVHAVSRYDTFKGVAMMSLLWFAWFNAGADEDDIRRDDRQGWVLIVLAGSVATVLLSRLMQLALRVHQRPIIAGLGLPFPAFIDPASVNPWNSFPSDHAMLFCALATGLWRLDRRLGALAFVWTLIGIDLPRIYLGLHYPSDVIAGALLGILCMELFARLPLWPLALRTLAWSRRHPGPFYWAAFLVTEQVAHLFDDIRQLAYTLLGHIASH